MENPGVERNFSLDGLSTSMTGVNTPNDTARLQQYPQYNNLSGYSGNNPMNMSGLNPLQQGQQMQNQQNFSGFGGFPMNNNNMQNQGVGTPMGFQNFDMLQKMGAFFPQMFAQMNPMAQMNQMSQMNPMGQQNPMDYFALANSMIMNSNMQMNPMGSTMGSLGSMNNLGQTMGQQNQLNPSIPQNMFNSQKMAETSKPMDNQNYVEGVMSNYRSNLNQFYQSLNNNNKDVMPRNNNENFEPNTQNYLNTSLRFSDDRSDGRLPYQSEFIPTNGANQGYSQRDGFESEKKRASLIPDQIDNGYEEGRNSFSSQLYGRGQNQENSQNDRERGKPSNRREDTPEQQRKAFDWEDKPIKSSYNPRLNTNNREEDQYASNSKGEIDQPVENEYKNPYDDIPVGGNGGKRFEDLLQEQLKANPDAVSSASTKRPRTAGGNFLKKNSRPYLSSANTGQAGKHAQKENIQTSPNSKADLEHENPFNRTKNKTTLKADNSFVNQQETKNKFETTLGREEGNQTTSSNKPKQKFLQRGGGIGGGIGNVGPSSGSMRNVRSLKSEEEEDERSKSVTKGRSNSRKNLHEPNERNRNDKSVEKQKKKEGFYPDNAHADNKSFEREYNMDRYLPSKSPKGKKLETKARKYQFEEEGMGREENFEEEEEKQGDGEDEEPQVSSLVNKYFYKAKQQQQGKKKGKAEEAGEEVETEDDKVQKFVNEKIEILNSEIAKFKMENERVKKLRQKHEDLLKNLNRDIAEWNKQKDKEMKEFEEWKQEEMRKIRNEKKLAERQQKTLANMPNRKEREEIENLKKQVAKLTEEMQLKEKRSKLNIERLKKQIDEVEHQNTELQEDMKGYDQYKPKTTNAGAAGAAGRGLNSTQDRNRMKQNTAAAAHNYRDEEQEEQYEDEEEERNDEGNEEEEEVEYDDENNEDGSDGEGLTYDDIVNKGGNKGETQKRSLGSSGKFGQEDRSTNQRKNQNDFGKTGKVEEYNFNSNPYFQNHERSKSEANKIVNQTISPDGKIQRIYANGKKEVVFHNGVKREIMPDGYTIVYFTNNDIKQTLPDGTIIYFFADAQTTQTTLPNGLNIYRFANSQLEFHNPDGSKEIKFSDGTRKIIYLNGEEVTTFTDGTVQSVNAQRVKTINYVNGQKDIIDPEGLKIRTYPDGRMKKYYADGRVEEIKN